MTAAMQITKVEAVTRRLADLEVVGGRILADRLLNGFLADMTTLLATPERHLHWALTAHRTAGMAGMLGFTDVAEAFARIEDGDTSPASLAAAAQTLDEAVALLAVIRALRHPGGEPA